MDLNMRHSQSFAMYSSLFPSVTGMSAPPSTRSTRSSAPGVKSSAVQSSVQSVKSRSRSSTLQARKRRTLLARSGTKAISSSVTSQRLFSANSSLQKDRFRGRSTQCFLHKANARNRPRICRSIAESGCTKHRGRKVLPPSDDSTSLDSGLTSAEATTWNHSRSTAEPVLVSLAKRTSNKPVRSEGVEPRPVDSDSCFRSSPKMSPSRLHSTKAMGSSSSAPSARCAR
mmetsp:Transcript_31808/g.82382  ORF Transcript_31808/g.82382 Transcript_31808/m.82382 type:complete len:228 (-) Transcript_31808:897-1580(-)